MDKTTEFFFTVRVEWTGLVDKALAGEVAQDILDALVNEVYTAGIAPEENPDGSGQPEVPHSITVANEWTDNVLSHNFLFG